MAQTINLSSSTPAAPANAVNVAWQNDSSNPPNVSANIPSGVGGGANIVAKSTLTAQTAAIAATTLYAIPSSGAGLYRVSFVATITTAATTGAATSSLGGSTGFQLKYTNIADSVVKTTNPTTANISAANTTGTSISGDLFAYCNASTNLQYLFGYTSNTAAQMTFDITIYVEYVGP